MQSMKRCDQLTTRGHGDQCSRKAVVIGINRDGTEEAYCAQHANYYGARRRKHRPVKSDG